jgi:protein FRG1
MTPVGNDNLSNVRRRTSSLNLGLTTFRLSIDWVLPEQPAQILGPTFLYHPSDPPVCIAYDSTRNKISLPAISLQDPETSEAVTIKELYPREVQHVWVVTRVAGTDTINLRTPEGKFISSDKHGLVSADREARGPQEEWTPLILEDGCVALQNMYGNYLGLDEVAGGALSLRADAESVGFQEKWWVKVQAKYKRQAGEEERKRKEVTEGMSRIDEAGTK